MLNSKRERESVSYVCMNESESCQWEITKYRYTTQKISMQSSTGQALSEWAMVDVDKYEVSCRILRLTLRDDKSKVLDIRNGSNV